MSQARGSKVTMAVYEESTFGVTPGSPSGFKGYFVSHTLDAKQPLIQPVTLSGDRRQGEPDYDNLDVSGNIVREIGAQDIGLFLKHALGAVSTTDTGGGPGPNYSHSFTVGDLPTSLMLEFDHGSAIASTPVSRYNGMRVKSMTLDFGSSGYPQLSFAMVGAKHTLVAALADASLTDNGHSSMSAFKASITEGGSAIATVTKGQIVLDNDLDTQSGYVVGGGAGGPGTRASLDEGFAMVSGNITCQFTDASLLNKGINGTSSSLLFKMQNGTGDGTTGNELFSLELKHMKYERTAPPISGPRGMVVDYRFTAFLSTDFIEAILKNEVASY